MGISPPPSGTCGIGYRELNPRLRQIVISWRLLCLLQRLVDSSGSNQLSPRAGSSPHSASANLLGGIVTAPRSPAGIQGAQLHPTSPSSQFALFQIVLCSLPSTGERGNLCFAFYGPSSPVRPLSSVQNYLQRAHVARSETTDPWPWRKSLPVPKARPPERPKPLAFVPLS